MSIVIASPQNVSVANRLLALQDIMRVRAQHAAKLSSQIQLMAHVSTLPAPLAGWISSVLRYWSVDVAAIHILAFSAILALGLKIVSMHYRTKSRSLNMVSRQALAVAITSRAYDQEPRRSHWESVYSKVDHDLSTQQLDAHVTSSEQHTRFDTWWQLNREVGTSRLAGFLIENVAWTKDILRVVQRRQLERQRIFQVAFILAMLGGIVLAPEWTRYIVETGIIAALVMLLAYNGMGLAHEEQEVLQECEAVYTSLNGIDRQEHNEASIIASTARYLAATMFMPPLPSAQYEKMRDELARKYSSENLQRTLVGT